MDEPPCGGCPLCPFSSFQEESDLVPEGTLRSEVEKRQGAVRVLVVDDFAAPGLVIVILRVPVGVGPVDVGGAYSEEHVQLRCGYSSRGAFNVRKVVLVILLFHKRAVNSERDPGGTPFLDLLEPERVRGIFDIGKEDDLKFPGCRDCLDEGKEEDEENDDALCHGAGFPETSGGPGTNSPVPCLPGKR